MICLSSGSSNEIDPNQSQWSLRWIYESLEMARTERCSTGRCRRRSGSGSNEVQIDVEWCGICGTDVEEYTSGPIVIPTTPHPLTGLAAPMIIGHEVAGRMHRAGRDSGHLRVGQLVGIDGSFFCGSCAACQRHQMNICEKWAFIGMSYPGGLAERMTVPSYMVVPVSDDIPAEWVALAEPFSVATRAVDAGGWSAAKKW